MMRKKSLHYAIAVALLICLCALQLCVGGAAATDAPGVMPTLGSESISSLQEHGVYTVGYSEDSSPFSYTSTNGNPVGIAIDVMDYIAQVATIEVSYISIEEAVRNNIPIDINLAILEKDQMEVACVQSLAYTSIQMMAVSNDAVIESQGATVGHLAYYYLDNDAVEQALPGCTSYTYFSYAEMAQDFLLGNIDYMLVTSLVSSQLLETAYQVDTYSIPTKVNLDFYMSYSKNLADSDINAIDSIIQRLDSDYIYSLMLNSAINSADVEITLEKIFQSYATPILISILIVVAAIAAIMLRATYTKRRALEHALNVDNLTGLMSERKFMSDAGVILKDITPGEHYIITIDIDRFKAINEIYGYDVGTKAIVHFGKMLVDVFPEGTLIARFFADNFVVLFRSVDDDFHNSRAAEYESYISKAMKDLLGEDYRLTTSTGIYQIENTTLPISYMIDCANVARLQGKTDYGISKMEFTRGLEQRTHQKNDIVRSMEKAIADKEFQIYYQPKISLKTGELVGAEALIRWIRPDGQRRYPDEFIPLFESNGFIYRVDLFVLESVCEFLQHNPTLPKVSVNFSGVSMLGEHLVEQVEGIVRSYQIDPQRLEIEITESAVVRNFETIVKQTTKLKELGFSISMDDFGAGISSLNRLKDLDIDVLKIDRAFLSEETLGSRSISIIHHIITMSRELGITTVAEGVEYGEQELLLKDLGCDMVQGYHYARPLPEGDYLAFLREYKK